MTITVRGPTSMSISARNWEDDSLRCLGSLSDFAAYSKREEAYLTFPWA